MACEKAAQYKQIIVRRCSAVLMHVQCRVLATALSQAARIAVAVGIMAAAASALVHASSAAQQELAEVKHSTPKLDNGAEQFDICSACHGPDGGGTRDGQVPRIGGQHISVLWKQLVDYRHDRRWDVRMEHFADRHHLPDAQAIADVSAYIHQLEPHGPSGQGSGKLLNAGAALYVQHCRSCHGATADGDGGRAIPKIAGQHYDYLRRQFYDAVDGRRPNFSPEHIRLLARLDHDDIEALADYLSRLPDKLPQRSGAGDGIP
jgi:cytochrome c553